MNLDPKVRLHLGVLLSSLQIDAFTKVKAFIDQLVEDMKKEQADEVKQKDNCVENMAQNDRDTAQKEWEVKNLVAKIEQLTADSKALAEQLKTLKAEIADLQVELQRAGDDRKAEMLSSRKQPLI